MLWRSSDTAQTRQPALVSAFSEEQRLLLLPQGSRRRQRAARVGRTRPSLEDAVLFIVGLKVFIHATGVGHLFAIDLWQEVRVLDPPLLVEQDVSRVGVDLLRLHFLVGEDRSVIVTKGSTFRPDETEPKAPTIRKNIYLFILLYEVFIVYIYCVFCLNLCAAFSVLLEI